MMERRASHHERSRLGLKWGADFPIQAAWCTIEELLQRRGEGGSIHGRSNNQGVCALSCAESLGNPLGATKLHDVRFASKIGDYRGECNSRAAATTRRSVKAH
jgi:hypothetical protein